MFTDNELTYLADQQLGRLATAQPSGMLQNSPVSFGWNAATQTIDIGGYHLADTPLGAGPIIRIHPTRIISWGIDPEESSLGKRDV